MEPVTALIVTASITGVLYMICLCNFARMGMKTWTNFSSPQKAAQYLSNNRFGKGFAIHIISGGLASLASMATIGCFIWFIVDKFA